MIQIKSVSLSCQSSSYEAGGCDFSSAPIMVMATKILFNECVSRSICSAPTSDNGLQRVYIVFRNLARKDSTNLSQKVLKNLGDRNCFLIIGIIADKVCPMENIWSDWSPTEAIVPQLFLVIAIKAASNVFSTERTKATRAVPVVALNPSISAVNETNVENSLLIVSASFSSSYKNKFIFYYVKQTCPDVAPQ